MFASGCLYEVKAGARAFVQEDLRQVLLYCAAAHEGGTHRISEVSLVNPREGVAFRSDLDQVALGMSALPWLELQREIVAFLSSGGPSG